MTALENSHGGEAAGKQRWLTSLKAEERRRWEMEHEFVSSAATARSALISGRTLTARVPAGL